MPAVPAETRADTRSEGWTGRYSKGEVAVYRYVYQLCGRVLERSPVGDGCAERLKRFSRVLTGQQGVTSCLVSQGPEKAMAEFRAGVGDVRWRPWRGQVHVTCGIGSNRLHSSGPAHVQVAWSPIGSTAPERFRGKGAMS